MFLVYTTAMIGLIFLALFAYKKFSVTGQKTKSDFLAVEDVISLNMRKQLYVVRAGKERFLIASDAERTTFLAKLEGGKVSAADVLEPPVDMDFDLQNIYPLRRESTTKSAGEILKNIVNSGERFNG